MMLICLVQTPPLNTHPVQIMLTLGYYLDDFILFTEYLLCTFYS